MNNLKIKEINDYCNIFIEMISERLKKYREDPNNYFGKSLYSYYINFYKGIINYYKINENKVFTTNNILLELKNILEENTYNKLITILEELKIIIEKELKLIWNNEKIYIETVPKVLKKRMVR